MIHVVLYSENRAAQCDVAIESLLSRLTADTPIHITVLFSASSDEFRRGYTLLASSYSSDRINFIEQVSATRLQGSQSHLGGLIRTMLNKQIVQKPDIVENLRRVMKDVNSECALFMRDEDIVLCDTYISPEMYTVVARSKGNNAVHLRLGLNIKHKPMQIRDQTRYCAWNSELSEREWSKRFSVDGTLLHTSSFLRVLDSVSGSSLQVLEQAINHKIRKDTFASTLYCFHRQRIVRAEIDDFRSLNASEINTEYLKGKRLTLSIPKDLSVSHVELQHITLSDSTHHGSAIRDTVQKTELIKKQEYHIAGSSIHVP